MKGSSLVVADTTPLNYLTIIGQVHAAGAHPVTLTTTIGTTRPVDMFSGEQLPRIC